MVMNVRVSRMHANLKIRVHLNRVLICLGLFRKLGSNLDPNHHPVVDRTNGHIAKASLKVTRQLHRFPSTELSLQNSKPGRTIGVPCHEKIYQLLDKVGSAPPHWMRSCNLDKPRGNYEGI